MKRYPGINYSQRPQSYWVDQTVLAALLRNVKGTERRKLITRYAKRGKLHELHSDLLKETLPAEAREKLGKIDPLFIGGEYLPDYANNETEIARIELASTTSDVISIRAQYLTNEISYRIIDEYETEFKLAFGTSRRPLTLEQLKVASLDGVRVDDAGSKGAMRPAARPTARCVRRHVRAFPTGHSLLVRHRSPRRS